MVSALEAPDTRGRRKTQASKSTWKSHNHIRRTKSFGFFLKTGSGHIFPQHSYQNVVVEVSFCLGTCEWQNLYLWGVMEKTSYGGCKLAHRTWQCSHKNLGKVEREMVRETHKTVHGCCKSDLIFNLRFDKYQERENFNVFRRMSWTRGWDSAGEW